MEIVEKLFRARQQHISGTNKHPKKITLSHQDYIELISERPYIREKEGTFFHGMEVISSDEVEQGKFIIE